ncbi:MAG: hypothetical protein LUC41_08740, partial [Clostridiales bacterium]|nr:hypothetical protein [Clostridiales bacterium]
SGNNIDMSNVIGGIRRTGEAAGIDPDKCSSKAFHRLYLRTREELLADMQVMADGIYQEMLKSEEEKIESLRDKYDQSPV